MIVPDYWLPCPPMALDDQTKLSCDAFAQVAMAHGPTTSLAYPLAIPKWQFLCYLVAHYPIVLHGSGNMDISIFEPRQSNDLSEFGAQKAVYAAKDGIWPLYFAIVDRSKSPTITNGCIRPEAADGSYTQAYYFFSISRQAIGQQPYRDGAVYLLPSDTFAQEPPLTLGLGRIHMVQYASPVAVQPLAKLTITPEDFPFLAQIRLHDDARLAEYGAAMMQGLPLPTYEL